MKNDLKNKVLLLTGGGGGIGRSIAQRAAELKMKVILFGGNDLAKLEETKKIVETHSTCAVFPGNLTDFDFLSESAAAAAVLWGGVDVLVNNAGSASSTPFAHVTFEEFDRIMTINVKVPFFLTQKLLPCLKRSAVPTVINIASVTGHAGYVDQSVYSASKHALLGMTKTLAAEYYKEGIRVHAISPGGVYTDMVKVTRPDLTPEGMIMPEDIADIVEFFLLHRSNAVVDEILVHRVGKVPFQI